MKIIAAYPFELPDGKNAKPDNTYEVGADEARNLIYRGLARLAPVIPPKPSSKDEGKQLPIEEN